MDIRLIIHRKTTIQPKPTKDFVTFTGPINYLPPHETTLIPIGLNSIDDKINLQKCYCLISKFEIDESKDSPNSY